MNLRAHSSIALALAATLTLIGQPALYAQQNWATVDDFALPAGDAEAHGVAVDAAGHIYVVGTANGHAIVRFSSDGGSNWVTRDDFVYPSSQGATVFNAITLDSQGDVLVGGTSTTSVGHWIVRRSIDQGATWQIVDDYYYPRNGPQEGTNAAVYSLSSDRQGRVFGAGLMHPTGPSYDYWLVRGSGSGGTNWDSKLVMFSGYTTLSQLTWAGEDVYVTGATSDTVINLGLILRSSDFGANWTTNFVATNEVYPAITSDSAGNVYAAGTSGNSGGQSVDWLVRKAAPGGTNWTILDRSTYTDTCSCGVSYPSPKSIAVDAAGNICVAGQFVDRYVVQIVMGNGSATVSWPAAISNGSLQWTDSMGTNPVWQAFTGTVSVVDGRNTATFQPTPGARFFQVQTTVHPTYGNTYGAYTSWFTRQYSAATGQWSTTDQFSYSSNRQGGALGTAIAPDGSTFVVGYGTSQSGQHRWVVRKQSSLPGL